MEALELYESECVTTLEQAQSLIVATPEQYVFAGEFIVGCKQLVAKIKAEFGPAKKKADEAHKAVVLMEKNALAPVEQAIAVAAGAALGWKQEEDRKARIEHERQETERRAEVERQRLAEAEMLEKWGETEAAEDKLRMAVIPARQLPFVSPAPKVAGLSSRKRWKGRIVKHRDVRREYCSPNETLINSHIANWFAYTSNPTPEQIKELEAEIGGVVVEEVEIFAGARK